jgi:hypothetical protein
LKETALFILEMNAIFINELTVLEIPHQSGLFAGKNGATEQAIKPSGPPGDTCRGPAAARATNPAQDRPFAASLQPT